MILTLAQTAAAPAAAADATTIAIGIVVVALSSIANLALAAKQLIGGNKGERQVEPTQLHAVVSELKDQTKALTNITTDVGIVKAKVESVEKSVDGFHQRVGGISRELAATTARVDGLEKREHS